MAGEINPTQYSNPPKKLRGGDWKYASVTGGIVNTTAVTLFAAVAGVSGGIEGLDYINTSATASEFEVYSGATVIYRGYAPASMTAPASIPGLSTAPLYGNAGEALTFKMVTTSTATRINARGGTNKR